MRHLVRARGLEGIVVDSCGTGSWHVGEAPHPGSAEIARKRGVSLAGQTSRQLCEADFERFDWIVAMDSSNLQRIRHLAPVGFPAGRMVLLLDYMRGDGPREVPDPYYEGGFPRVFNLIEDGCEGLLDELVGG